MRNLFTATALALSMAGSMIAGSMLHAQDTIPASMASVPAATPNPTGPYSMTQNQRTTAWTSIKTQVAAQRGGAKLAAGASAGTTMPPLALADQVQANPPSSEPASATPPNPATASSKVPPAMPADPAYNAGPYKGAATAAPAEAMNKTYPVCTRKVQDSCRNPGGK